MSCFGLPKAHRSLFADARVARRQDPGILFSTWLCVLSVVSLLSGRTILIVRSARNDVNWLTLAPGSTPIIVFPTIPRSPRPLHRKNHQRGTADAVLLIRLSHGKSYYGQAQRE